MIVRMTLLLWTFLLAPYYYPPTTSHRTSTMVSTRRKKTTMMTVVAVVVFVVVVVVVVFQSTISALYRSSSPSSEGTDEKQDMRCCRTGFVRSIHLSVPSVDQTIVVVPSCRSSTKPPDVVRDDVKLLERMLTKSLLLGLRPRRRLLLHLPPPSVVASTAVSSRCSCMVERTIWIVVVKDVSRLGLLTLKDFDSASTTTTTETTFVVVVVE